MHPQQPELQCHSGCSLSSLALKSTVPVLPLIFSLFCFSLPFIPSSSFLFTYFVPNKLKYASEFVIVLAMQTGCYLFIFSISDKILTSIYAPAFSQM